MLEYAEQFFVTILVILAGVLVIAAIFAGFERLFTRRGGDRTPRS